MSAERRHVDSPPIQSNRSRPELDARGVETPLTQPRAPVDAGSSLHHRIERQQLRTRVRALECQIAAHERERQALIDRYEYVLEERDRAAGDGRRGSESATRFGRLLDFLRR